MKKPFYYIPKIWLLFVAGLVWFIAGFNIVRIGVLASQQAWHIIPVLCALVVFSLFYGFIFRRLVKKHTIRISGYQEPRVNILRFFDAKSYCIMAFMMTFGIVLRYSNLCPAFFIKVFYTGLGAALIAAGVGFLCSFAVRIRQPSA